MGSNFHYPFLNATEFYIHNDEYISKKKDIT